MNALAWAITFILFCAAAWFAWRYYRLRRDIDRFASQTRNQITNTNSQELENLSSAITSLISTFDVQHSTLDAERARLAAFHLERQHRTAARHLLLRERVLRMAGEPRIKHGRDLRMLR